MSQNSVSDFDGWFSDFMFFGLLKFPLECRLNRSRRSGKANLWGEDEIPGGIKYLLSSMFPQDKKQFSKPCLADGNPPTTNRHVIFK